MHSVHRGVTMILGFLGKGGSGKSTTATQMALFLHKQGNDVLAVDADHNMDLAYNLFKGDMPQDMPYFGDALTDLHDHIELPHNHTYDQAFLKGTDARFSLFPHDACTEKLSRMTSHGISCMAAGPQTDNVLYGQKCSHSLTTPLKIFLPLLELTDNQMVIVDEKAGADGVSTGIVTGIDVGIIVCEPALHSIKTAEQIAELMDFYDTPYIFVANKVHSQEDKDFITETLSHDISIFFESIDALKRNPSAYVSGWEGELAQVLDLARQVCQNNRLERTLKKFTRNKTFTK